MNTTSAVIHLTDTVKMKATFLILQRNLKCSVSCRCVCHQYVSTAVFPDMCLAFLFIWLNEWINENVNICACLQLSPNRFHPYVKHIRELFFVCKFWALLMVHPHLSFLFFLFIHYSSLFSWEHRTMASSLSQHEDTLRVGDEGLCAWGQAFPDGSLVQLHQA